MARQGRNVERFERLARELAQGVSINDAMLAAGYSATSAKRGVIRHYSDWISPTAHPVVAAKLAEIRAHASEGASITLQDIVAQFGEAYTMAKEDRNHNAMIQATMGQAKVLGLMVEKRKNPLKPISQMSEEELSILVGETPGDSAAVHGRPWGGGVCGRERGRPV